jgi:RNA polymerase sigma-70 factor (ECF subfamily)
MEMADELDNLTLVRCQRGEARAFRTLVERYQDRVYGLCVALAGPDAEDLAQETFVRVHASVGAFDAAGPAPLSGWILTIARRLCADRARKRQRHARLAPLAPEREPAPRVDGALEAAERARAVRAAVAALPEEQRAVVALQAWDGLDYEQIAAIERVPVGTVRSRLARAKQALKRALGLGMSGDETDEERHGTLGE